MNNITSFRDLIYRRWDNQYMMNYDKVVKEFRMNIKIKENYKRVLNELKNMNWIKVNSEKNYDREINNIFDNTEELLNVKLSKYKKIISTIENKISINNKNKEKALNRFINESCPICYENEFKSYAVTRCGHFFCQLCIKKCISSQFKCPLCRSILFFEDVSFFSRNEYSFPGIDINIPNQVIDYSILKDNDIIFLPPLSSIVMRNPRDTSIIINMKNINGFTEQYDFDDYLDYSKFRNLLTYIEQNIKESYDKKMSKVINLLFHVMKVRRGGVNNLSEIVVPNQMDEIEP